LLCAYSKNTWTVTDIGNKKNIEIKFDVRLPGGKTLSDYPNLLESIKRVVYGVRTGPLFTSESGVTQASIAKSLIVLARWMLGNKIERFDDLTNSDIREYTELAIFGVHTILNIESVLSSHLDGIIAGANFSPDDEMEVQRAKAAAVFPVRFSSGSRGLSIDREKLLFDAGLEGVGCVAANSSVVSILDALEASCKFYQPPRVHRRMQNEHALLNEDAEHVVTEGQLTYLLKPFQYLHLHRRYLDDAIQRPPFPLSSVRKTAQKLGKAANRTRNVPVKQAATLIERSIRWVLDYGPIIVELKDWADAKFDQSPASAAEQLSNEISNRVWPIDGPSSPFPLLPGRRMEGRDGDDILQILTFRQGMTLGQAIVFLITACCVVIAAFSARRAAEIIGLKAGCINRDDAKQAWMNVFIYKTIQDDSLIPVPQVVVAAVDILEQLSARARIYTKTPYLIQYNRPGSDECIGLTEDGKPAFRLLTHLRRFGYFVDVPELEDGSRWAFSPHQFRRFFAILYIWIYELGDWGALSYHLRHFNLEMTRRYVSDDELGHIIALANREHTASILASAALGHSHMGGQSGERLKLATKRLYDRMSQHTQVLSERKFSQRILRMVERTGITLRPLPWGYCGLSSKMPDRECRCSEKDSNHPDFGKATVSICSKCALNVRTCAAAPYLQNAIEFHKKIVANPESPQILRRASSALSADLQDYLASSSSLA
jgi:integrase